MVAQHWSTPRANVVKLVFDVVRRCHSRPFALTSFDRYQVDGVAHGSQPTALVEFVFGVFAHACRVGVVCGSCREVCWTGPADTSDKGFHIQACTASAIGCFFPFRATHV